MRGVSVRLFEARRLGAMASTWTLGGVRQSGRDPAELPLARAAIESWARLDEALGAPTGYRRKGNLRLARTEGEIETLRTMVAGQRARGLSLEFLESRADIRAIAPAIGDAVLAASFCNSDGHADPDLTIAAYAVALRHMGVTLEEGVPVHRLVSEKGRVRGVETASGIVHADAVVLAAGIHAPALIAPLGLDLPMAAKRVCVLPVATAPAFEQVFGVAMRIAPAGRRLAVRSVSRPVSATGRATRRAGLKTPCARRSTPWRILSSAPFRCCLCWLASASREAGAGSSISRPMRCRCSMHRGMAGSCGWCGLFRAWLRHRSGEWRDPRSARARRDDAIRAGTLPSCTFRNPLGAGAPDLARVNAMLDPTGRLILVSGASRGIGRAIAEELYRQGYAVSLGVRDPAKLAGEFAGWDQTRLHIAPFIAEDWATHKSWIEAAAARFGRIDGLVNNAGTHSKMTLRAPDEAELDRVWAINCKAPLNLIHCALPHLEASGSGRIINIASLSGKRVRNDMVAYNMSKFALIALNHAARRIGWEKGVRANRDLPVFRVHRHVHRRDLPFAEMTTPQEIARLAATAIGLPNNAVVAEMLVNCRLEDTL